jgi:phosphatidylserine decarboxylase
MPAEPTRYWHRAKQALETEQIYGERWLRWVYETSLGRVALWLLVRRSIFSTYYGWRMNWRYSAAKVLPFIVDYNLDVDEFAKSAFAYRTFNEFFTRALKPEARPIAPGDAVAVFPADGRHLIFPDVEAAEGFYVKGARFTLAELLGEDRLPEEKRELSRLLAGGSMVISRLAPVDYHRFHFPVAGEPREPRLIHGTLASVHPIALRHWVRYLVENRRMVTVVDATPFGSIVMIEIGATMVGRIRQFFIPGRPVAKGAEKGLVGFGGSCVITLFAAGRIVFDADLVARSRTFCETYARMGERMGVVPGAE